jgi:hypothetical protein
MKKDSDNDEGPENDTIGPLIMVETPHTTLNGKKTEKRPRSRV